MKNPTELKKHTISRMAGCWGECCAVFFIMAGELAVIVLALVMSRDYLMNFTLANFPYGAAAALFAAITVSLWFAASPFAYGVKWYRIQQIRGVAVHARSMFSCCVSLKKLVQVLKLNSMLTLRRLPVYLTAAAAVWGEFYLLDKMRSAFSSSVIYSIPSALAVLFLGAVVCLLWVTGIKYALVPYLYVFDPGANPSDLIKKSKELMKTNYRYLLETLFSMIGWVIPCALIFPAIFIVPYIEMVYTAAINEIIEQDELSSKKETPQDGYGQYGKDPVGV